MALMIERDTSPRLDDDAPWTDDELDLLGELGSMDPVVFDDDDFVLPSDDELTEWSEDADALDSLTELWTEDQ